jgi:hypothetical protein
MLSWFSYEDNNKLTRLKSARGLSGYSMGLKQVMSNAVTSGGGSSPDCYRGYRQLS